MKESAKYEAISHVQPILACAFNQVSYQFVIPKSMYSCNAEFVGIFSIVQRIGRHSSTFGLTSKFLFAEQAERVLQASAPTRPTKGSKCSLCNVNAKYSSQCEVVSCRSQAHLKLICNQISDELRVKLTRAGTHPVSYSCSHRCSPPSS